MREGRVLIQAPQSQAALQGSAQVLRLVVLLPPLRQRLAYLQSMRLQRQGPPLRSEQQGSVQRPLRLAALLP